MLNELEKNKKIYEPARTEILSSINSNLKKYNFLFGKKILTWVLIVVAGISVCFFVYKEATSKHNKPAKAMVVAKKIVAAPKPKLVETPKVVAVTVPAIRLENIALRSQDNKTIIDFVLSAPTLYFVEYSADQQQLFVTLNNTGLQGNLPVALENTFIIALNTKQSGTNTICTLTILPGTKVSGLQMLDKPQPQLHLELSNLQLTDSKMAKTPVPISPQQQREQRYQQIQQVLAQNNIREAITQLHLFVGDFPESLQARETLVALLIKENDRQRANNVLMVGMNKNPKHAPFIKLKSHILAEQGKVDAAINLLQNSAALFTEDTEYFALLAVLYQEQGQFIKAARIYNQLTKIEPQKTIWWVGLGMALENAGKKNAAKEAYQRAYNSSETTPDLVAFLAGKIKE
jgi:tetratricopeptide (TPR) repeat protein